MLRQKLRGNSIKTEMHLVENHAQMACRIAEFRSAETFAISFLISLAMSLPLEKQRETRGAPHENTTETLFIKRKGDEIEYNILFVDKSPIKSNFRTVGGEISTFICLSQKYGTQLLYIESDLELKMMRQFVADFKSKNKKIIDLDEWKINKKVVVE